MVVFVVVAFDFAVVVIIIIIIIIRQEGNDTNWGLNGTDPWPPSSV